MLTINNIKYLNQRDPKWKDVKIGPSPLTVGDMGCTLTCVAMGENFLGGNITPGELAQHKDWFNDAGEIKWMNLKLPNADFRWRESGCNRDMIRAYLSHGDNRQADHDRFVLLEVNHQHWVLGLWEENGDILSIDPWYGKTTETLYTYKQITAAVLFVRKKPKVIARTLGTPVAPNYN